MIITLKWAFYTRSQSGSPPQWGTRDLPTLRNAPAPKMRMVMAMRMINGHGDEDDDMQCCSPQGRAGPYLWLPWLYARSTGWTSQTGGGKEIFTNIHGPRTILNVHCVSGDSTDNIAPNYVQSFDKHQIYACFPPFSFLFGCIDFKEKFEIVSVFVLDLLAPSRLWRWWGVPGCTSWLPRSSSPPPPGRWSPSSWCWWWSIYRKVKNLTADT